MLDKLLSSASFLNEIYSRKTSTGVSIVNKSGYDNLADPYF